MPTNQELAQALAEHYFCLDYVVEALRMDRTLTQHELHNYRTCINALQALLSVARGSL